MPTPSRIGVGPNGMLTLDGQELDRNDPRLYGSRGQQQASHQSSVDEAGYSSLIPATEGWQGLQDRSRYQLNSAGVSSGQEGQGFNEFNVNHIGDLQYDPEYGITTSNQSFIEGDDPDDRARMHRWRTAVLASMAAGAGGAMLGAEGFAGAGAETAGAWGLAGEATGAELAAYQAALGTGGSTAGGVALGELGSGTTLAGTGLGAGGSGALGTGANLAGTGLVSGTGAGLAGTAVTGAELAAGGGALAGLAPVSGAIGSGTGIPAIDFIRDAATRIATGSGGLMPSAAGNIFGIDGFSNADLLNYGSRLAGTYFNNQNAGENREANARENQLTREQQLLLAMVNQETPYGNVEYSRDPVTGAIRRRATMNAADQHNLDLSRGIRTQAGEAYKPYDPSVTQRYIDLAMGGRQMNPKG